jgi:hypothetical protein
LWVRYFDNHYIHDKKVKQGLQEKNTALAYAVRERERFLVGMPAPAAPVMPGPAAVAVAHPFLAMQ